jgi:hypothetical protein
MDRLSLTRSARIGLLALLAIAAFATFAFARDAKSKSAAAVATSASPKGMILRCEEAGEKWTPGAKWEVADDKAALSADHLLVGLPGAEIDSANKAVHVRLLTDFDSPLAILEPAILLHTPEKLDLELTLDRGMIELVSTKKGNAAFVRVHVRDAVFDLTLYTPGTKVTLLLASAWVKGVPFTQKPGPKDVPTAELMFVVQKGDVDVRHDGRLNALAAPPGPAVIRWDNVNGIDSTATHLGKLPAWILPPTDPAEKEKVRRLDECVAAFCKDAADHSLSEVLDHFLSSDNRSHRHFAVILLGATDNLRRLAQELNSTKYPDTWDASVKALRHWIGRGPRQDMVLYNRLVELRGLKPTEAATVLHFLHTPDDAELARPETYEMLIDYLNSRHLAIRGLAFWHLYRLVPQGRSIPYDPLAAEEERQKARNLWKELIPDGQLPPKQSANKQEQRP